MSTGDGGLASIPAPQHINTRILSPRVQVAGMTRSDNLATASSSGDCALFELLSVQTRRIESCGNHEAGFALQVLVTRVNWSLPST
jgi:hypothetical protein